MTQENSEQWKGVLGYEDIYSVSNKGRVKSLKSNTMKTLSNHTAGYFQVSLWKNGVCKWEVVHRLVAQAFIGPDIGLDVCHNDGNPQNNCVENLRYGTRAENMQDARRHGRTGVGTANSGVVLTEEIVYAIREAAAKREMSQRDIADQFGVNQSHVSQIHRRVLWKDLPERKL